MTGGTPVSAPFIPCIIHRKAEDVNSKDSHTFDGYQQSAKNGLKIWKSVL